jgi:hypothetical protein
VAELHFFLPCGAEKQTGFHVAALGREVDRYPGVQLKPSRKDINKIGRIRLRNKHNTDNISIRRPFPSH